MRLAHKLMMDIISNTNINWYEDYAEPGYSLEGKLGIFAENWNPPRMERIGNILEKLGYALEWSDEWTGCGECCKAVRIVEDSYSWKPYYKIIKCELFCLPCAKAVEEYEEYMESLTEREEGEIYE